MPDAIPARPAEASADARGAVVARYSTLAVLAQNGGTPLACEPGSTEESCLGAAAYAGEALELGEPGGVPEAALRASLGCGNPLAVADLQPGEIVLDLGSGGGLDVLLSARRVGPGGKAYGLDASPEMLALARSNAAQAEAANAEFLHGHIEDIPLPGAAVDVVISNCVINLSADKPRVLAEIYRVLRPGGRMGISDVIIDDGWAGRHDPAQRAQAEQAVGCANGALTAAEYRHLLTETGFETVTVTPTSSPGHGLHAAIIKSTKPH